MSYIYLASPYSNPEPKVRAQRYHAACTAAAWLLRQHQWCYSPIVHCHRLAETASLPTDAAFWRDYNFAMLGQAQEFMVLTLDGWAQSIGIDLETREANRLKLPVTYLRPELCGANCKES